MNSKIDTAVIMAAGKGTRFGEMTADIPKGFIPFKNIPMIIRSIRALINHGIKNIIIGTGYHHEHYDNLAKQFPQIKTVFSPRFAETNSMMTLFNSRHAIGDKDFLLLESDIIYQPEAIEKLLSHPAPDVMLITPVTKFQDQYYVSADKEGNLINCSTSAQELNYQGELVGIHKISAPFFKLLCETYNPEEQPKLGYEFQILRTAQSLRPMKVLSLPGLQWYEIDDIADLDFATRYINIT